MAWKHGHSVIEWKQFTPDAVKERVPVSTWKVPSADTFAKKHVSPNDNLLIKKVKAQAPWTMAGYVVDAQSCSKKLSRSIFVEKEIRSERIDFQFESPAAEKATVADHRSRVGMKSGLAAMALDYRRSIGHVIEMSMGEEQQVDLFVGEGEIRPLRSVEKNSALRRLIVKTIGVEHTAGETFKTIHSENGQRNDVEV
jgi:hypothetical protein